MFTQKTDAQIGALGEVSLIDKINVWLGSVCPAYPEGMGDDCAVVTPSSNHQQIITTDSLTFGQHFDASVSAENAGAKLIKRNLSDIAAMGGTPDHAVLALLCGSNLAIDWLEDFFAGIRKSCEDASIKLVGGDVSSLAPGQFSAVLTLVGHVQETKLRHGASIGDSIYVTGSLGGSILNKHYTFTPRLAEGQWLAKQPCCTALMDLTDGLAKDLKALLPDEASAQIDLTTIPIAVDARTLAETSQRPLLEHAFCDGEDYELLFTVSAATPPADFERAWQQTFPDLRLSGIGQIVGSSASSPLLIDAATNEALPWTEGFEHLRA